MAFNGAFYDRLYKDKPYAREVERMLPYLKGKTLLDIGGGTGGHAVVLKGKGFEPHVIDLSASMLAIAANKGLTTEIADIATYRSKKTYDSAIAMFHVLNFCKDLTPVLANIRDALQDGGVLVFDMWDPTVKKEGSAWRFDGLMTRYSRKKWRGNEVYIDFFFPFFLRFERNHLYCPSAYDMKKQITEAGFTLEKWEEDGLNFFGVAKKI